MVSVFALRKTATQLNILVNIARLGRYWENFSQSTPWFKFTHWWSVRWTASVSFRWARCTGTM